VEAVDGAAADLAVKLLAQRNTNEKVCSRCLGADSGHKCTKCGRSVSAQQRLNDAMIAATADVRAVTLYAFDTGVLSFTQYVGRCRIERPPGAYGPLFDQKKGE
jgi:ribosomal protein L40E